MKQPSEGLMAHLLCVALLNYTDGMKDQNLIKAIRKIERFARINSEEFEKSDNGSEYQARCMHNFNVVMDAIDLETLLMPIGELIVEK